MSPKSNQILPICEWEQLIGLFSFAMKLEILAYFVIVAVLSDSINSMGGAFGGNKDSVKQHNSPSPILVNTLVRACLLKPASALGSRGTYCAN